jgi:hypothetical protein
MKDDPFLGSEEIPWPEKGDRLFAAGGDWGNNACLNFMGGDWTMYILGYKKAGDVLVEFVKETQSEQDILVYPIVFMYRQYLELRLKWLIQVSYDLLDRELDFPRTHKLDILWNRLRIMLPQIEASVLSEDLEAIDDAISQFCKIDPTSETFRYPTNKEGDNSLSPDVRIINLRQLGDIMQKIASYFDATANMLSVYRDYKSDLESDFGAPW